MVLLWTVLFQRKFSVLQWYASLVSLLHNTRSFAKVQFRCRFSIALLIGGCVLIRMGKGYVVVLSWALVYVVAQAFVSAVAGVVNEYLFVACMHRFCFWGFCFSDLRTHGVGTKTESFENYR